MCVSDFIKNVLTPLSTCESEIHNRKWLRAKTRCKFCVEQMFACRFQTIIWVQTK